MAYSIFKLIIFVVVVICCVPISLGQQSCSQIKNDFRVDCFPEKNNANEKTCLARGCCWQAPSSNASNDTPYCYFPSDFPTYEVVSSSTLAPNTLTYSLVKSKPTFRPNEILRLDLRITYETTKSLHVQIVDANSSRYEVPLININRPYQRAHQDQVSDDFDYQIAVQNKPFSLQIFRKSNGRLLFDTSLAPLIYADQYIQFTTKLASKYVYGLGEHRDSLLHGIDWTSFTFWNRDISPTLNTNLYGTHPFYLNMEEDGNANGLFLLNSNGMDVNLQPAPAITFITIGGIIDFRFFVGPKPENIIEQYTSVIGRSLMPPYFSLGFHLCRWRYDNQTHLMEVIKRTRASGIPYDTQWSDIDVMSSLLDWTYDSGNFSMLPSIVQDLHDHGQHYINIIDPGISNRSGYKPFEEGLVDDIFIKTYNSSKPLIGRVWPGTTCYPDFTHPNATNWWLRQASRFHSQIPFDGIWIDMNEPSNFIDGSTEACTRNSLDLPPYTPKVMGLVLFSRTICPSAPQYLSSHYNLHNMYGHFEAISTYNVLQALKPNKRPFVLSRSTFAGTGQFAAHWSGDNRARWEDLYYSIPNMLAFNMFGVSMVGSDICGFIDDTTEELCIRWMQLGSFYPFMRNHNNAGNADQDPGVFSKQAQEIMRSVVRIRYSLLPYLYTAYYHSHVYGRTVVKPLFFEYPTDPNTYSIDRQFLFGSAIMITPVLEPGASTVNAYFTDDVWYDFYTGQQYIQTKQYSTLDAPIDKINIHLRGGYIVPFQFPEVTTTQSRLNPFGVIVALKYDNNGDSYANGTLYWDDGESIDSISNKKYNLFDMSVTKDCLLIKQVNVVDSIEMRLNDVLVVGVKQEPNRVTINGQDYNDFVYDESTKTLSIQYFDVDMLKNKSIVIAWST